MEPDYLELSDFEMDAAAHDEKKDKLINQLCGMERAHWQDVPMDKLEAITAILWCDDPSSIYHVLTVLRLDGVIDE